MVYSGRNRNVNIILQHFAVMWGLTLFGVFIGIWLPSSIVALLAFISLLLILVNCFVKHIRLPDIILYIVPFLTGIMLFWIYLFFIDIIAEELMITVFICTVIIFILLTLAGMKIPGEVTEIISIIFTVIVVILVFSIYLALFPVENTFLLFFAALFVLLFAVYVAYEFTVICHNYVRDDDVVFVALNLYLGLFNLIANILFIARNSRG